MSLFNVFFADGKLHLVKSNLPEDASIEKGDKEVECAKPTKKQEATSSGLGSDEAANLKPKRVFKRCIHGRASDGYSCKECGGAGICEHGRRKNECKDCGGSSICPHSRQRYYCKDCGGSGHPCSLPTSVRAF